MCEAGTSMVELGEAARLLETTEMRVLMLLKNRQLQGEMVNDNWYVERSSLQLCARPQAADIVKPGCGGGCGGCGGH